MLVVRFFIVILLILAANVWAVSASPTAAATLTGEAFGVASGVPATPVTGSPYVVLPPEGGTQTDAAPGVGIGVGNLVGSATQVRSTTTGSHIGEGGTVTSTSTVEFAELFAGLVRASEMRAVATSTQDGGRAFSTGTVQFRSLIIAGLSYSNPSPNERVDLPGVGYVVLNEQILGGDSRTSSSMIVRAIRVVVTSPGVLDVPAGTEVIVAGASSGVPDISNFTPIASGPPPPPTRVQYVPISQPQPIDNSSDNGGGGNGNGNGDDDSDDNGNGNGNDNGGAAASGSPTRAAGTSGPIVVTVVVVVVTPTSTPTATKSAASKP